MLGQGQDVRQLRIRIEFEGEGDHEPDHDLEARLALAAMEQGNVSDDIVRDLCTHDRMRFDRRAGQVSRECRTCVSPSVITHLDGLDVISKRLLGDNENLGKGRCMVEKDLSRSREVGNVRGPGVRTSRVARVMPGATACSFAIGVEPSIGLFIVAVARTAALTRTSNLLTPAHRPHPPHPPGCEH